MRAEQPAEHTAPATNAFILENCIGGAPIKTKDLGETQVIARKDYALEHSARYKVPLWVCEHIEPDELAGSGNRKKSRYKPDPLLPAGKRAELSDYSRSGYDRGHQAPAADFKYAQARTDDCFFLSNMAPQVGRGFNRHIWAALENHTRELALSHGGAYVITGGYFVGPVTTIGKSNVGVPSHFYKIIVVEQDGKLAVGAYVLQNRRYPNEDFDATAAAIDDIEASTGLDFMPTLSEQQQDTLERSRGRL